MSAVITVEGAEWSHHCMACENLFDAVDLNGPCPQCGRCDRRETISLDGYLNERYGIMTPDGWLTTLGIEDLTSPEEAPDAG